MSVNHYASLTGIGLPLCLGFDNEARRRQKALHYEHPDVADVARRTEVIEGRNLAVDLYYPPDVSRGPRPVVVFVLAFPDTSALGPMRDLEVYQAWARLVAAERLVGVLYEVSAPEADLETVMTFLLDHAARLGIDPGRVALWSASGNTALALKHARVPSAIEPVAVVAYYGIMPTPDQYQGTALASVASRNGFALPTHDSGERYRSGLPMLVVRAGLDTWQEILSSIDHFVEYALRENLAVTVVNYPGGQHAFDSRDDTAETRVIIRQTLDFLRRHLGL